MHSSNTDTHNSTNSSGSHILTPGPEDHSNMSLGRTETAEIHSVDSSVSGSHSLASPIKDRSREGTPGNVVDVQLSVNHAAETEEEKGASSTIVTNAIVCAHVDTNTCHCTQTVPANQNAYDNDNHSLNQSLSSIKSSKLANNSGLAIIETTSALVTHDGEGRTNTFKPVNPAHKPNFMLKFNDKLPDVPVHSCQKSPGSSLGREPKKVVFTDDTKIADIAEDRQVKDRNAAKLDKVVKVEHVVTVEIDIENRVDNADLTVVSETGDLPEQTLLPSSHETVEHIGVVSSVDNLDLEAHRVSCVLTDIEESPASSPEETKSMESNLSVQTNGSMSITSSCADPQGHDESQGHINNEDDDLTDGISYLLHRRHLEDDSEAVRDETARQNSKSPDDFSNRRSRSLKKRRPTNMLVQTVKVYEGGTVLPAEDNNRSSSPATPPSTLPSNNRRIHSPVTTPSPGSYYRTASPATPPGTLPHGAARRISSQSPTGTRCGYSSRSPSLKRTLSMTLKDRSPSASRRFELVNFHRLPHRDSFSSIDDTTSPDFEKDIIRHIQSKDLHNSNGISGKGHLDITEMLVNGKIILTPEGSEITENGDILESDINKMTSTDKSKEIEKPTIKPKPVIAEKPSKSKTISQNSIISTSNQDVIVKESNMNEFVPNETLQTINDKVTEKPKIHKPTLDIVRVTSKPPTAPSRQSYSESHQRLIAMKSKESTSSEIPPPKTISDSNSFGNKSNLKEQKIIKRNSPPINMDLDTLGTKSDLDKSTSKSYERNSPPEMINSDLFGAKPKVNGNSAKNKTPFESNAVKSCSNQKTLDLSSSNTINVDFTPSAAAFILSEKDYARSSNRNSMTFSTFKPAVSPGSRPLSWELSGEESRSVLSSMTDSDTSRKLTQSLCTLPPENIFRPTDTKPKFHEHHRNDTTHETAKSKTSRSSGIIRNPAEPRKLSFTRERGYMYSFESVNDPPNTLVCIGDINIDSDSNSMSPDSKDVLRSLEDMPPDQDTTESDTTESENSYGEDSEHESSDDDDDVDGERHKEFLQFAKSLADSGKETTIDSGFGVEYCDNNQKDMSPVDPLELLENVDTEGNVYETNIGKLPRKNSRDIKTGMKYNCSNLSTSSEDSYHDQIHVHVRGKRVSKDPLEDLENSMIAEIASSGSSLEESDTETTCSKKSSNTLPILTFSSASSPDEPLSGPRSHGKEVRQSQH